MKYFQARADPEHFSRVAHDRVLDSSSRDSATLRIRERFLYPLQSVQQVPCKRLTSGLISSIDGSRYTQGESEGPRGALPVSMKPLLTGGHGAAIRPSCAPVRYCIRSIRIIDPFECRRWRTRGGRTDRSSLNARANASSAQLRDDLGEYNEYEVPIDEAVKQKGLDEYKELKGMLLRRTWKFGALFSVYLFLVLPSTNASVMELLGCGAGYAYLWLLMRHVDSYNEETDTPMFEAERIDAALVRNVAKATVGYRYSLNPRLLIPVGLALGCFIYNNMHDAESQLGLVEEGCLMGGFLGFKVSLITKVYDDLRPKVLSAEELMREKRPDLVEIDGDVDESRLWEKKKNGENE